MELRLVMMVTLLITMAVPAARLIISISVIQLFPRTSVKRGAEMEKDKPVNSVMIKIMLLVMVALTVLSIRDGSALEGRRLRKMFAIKFVEMEGEMLEK